MKTLLSTLLRPDREENPERAEVARAANLPVGNHVPPGRLSRREKRLLVEGLRTIEGLQKRVAAELSGDVLTGGDAVRPA